VTAGHETCHDGVVGSNSVFITPGLEGLLEDEVAIGMIGNHHILVAGPGLDGETSGVICVELADGDDTDVDFFERELRFFGGDRRKKQGGVESRGVGLGQADILASLCKVAKDGLVRIRAVAPHVGVGEPIKGITATILDGVEPCLFGREAQTGMVEPDESSNAGEVQALGIEGSFGGLGC
jgi:hypothetical protein